MNKYIVLFADLCYIETGFVNFLLDSLLTEYYKG